jgi:hypothetical protein
MHGLTCSADVATEPKNRSTTGAGRLLVTGNADLRVDLPCTVAGFSAPPCHVHLKFVSIGGRKALLALTDPGKPAAVEDWLAQYGPSAVHIAPGLTPKFLQADFVKLPDAWARLLSSVHVRHLELSPDGTASLFIEGPIDQIEDFVKAIKLGRPVARSRKTVPGSDRVKLSHRQLQALSNAVALGYFEIPHRLDLRALAKKMGMSHGALSELLRRAEALVITGYIDSLTESHWDGPLPKALKDPAAPSDRTRTIARPLPLPKAPPRRA